MLSTHISDEASGWLALAEGEFLDTLEQLMAESGNPGNVFPPMVSYNVPWFVLRELWPEAYEALKTAPVWMAFAAAEDGWRGRLDNLRSSAAPEGALWRVEFQKSYVMTATRLLLLLGGAHGPALCQLNPQSAWEWVERVEPGLRLVSGHGRVVAHHRVRGSATVRTDAIFSPGRRAYSRVGLLIPRREVTGMAMMAIGMLRFLGRPPDATLIGERDRIRAGRAAGRLAGEETTAALRILDRFYASTEGDSLEPFWAMVRSFRQSVTAVLRASKESA